MHTHQLEKWTHDHVFGQDQQREGEKRTLLIVLLTAAMMVVEISTGLISGSMALLADGLHMASHTVALGISVFAYVISRRLASDRRFAFGVGKINSLAGFASAILLLGFALTMVIESTGRLIDPVAIVFDQAIMVATIGLVVNGFSAWVLLSTPHEHGHSHDHTHTHTHDHAHEKGHDHNLRGAYLHVLADALTSILAIVALLAGKYMGASWLDPLMGIVGAALVTRWSFGLIREASKVLLDSQADDRKVNVLRAAIEHGSSDRVTDLHLWSIGHGIFAAEIAIVSDEPRSPEHYKSLIPAQMEIVHATVEVHRCLDH
ncbi:CDF family Co(II)/Ni(II) efflux transporter DmeF [Congregibacter litoralis]|uniref:Cation diffusion facilitator family transporter n=1 Tax=Congregibacter litoralis KT71 TaxID=314285 RepID=A4AA28_9GAMM|nr:CDF family Co(II)/Ni(II) efflux transporter DmeF [Congregibacter litoralis]EAQ97345.1 cation diffusion facilitator family transporter [Congregibacter litoralis KT71]